MEHPAPHRILFVHAHPDDETIGSGTTMARYAADARSSVTLVTCTLGEEGEIVLPEVAHLAADQEDRLGEHRMTELAGAMAALGVTDWRLLGGPGTYRDSGMVGTPSNVRPDCFWRADLLEAATHLVAVIREVRPQVLATYDDFGGYGHPDHIQAHRVAMYAVTLAEAPSFRPDLGEAHSVAKVYWTAFPRGVMRAGIEALRAAGETTGFAAMDPDDLPFGVDDALVTTAIDGGAFYEAEAQRHASPRHPDLPGQRVLRTEQQHRRTGDVSRVLPARAGDSGRALRLRRPGDRPLRRGVEAGCEPHP